MVASSEVTYSFFFLRDKQADSRFFIIRCWRLKALAWFQNNYSIVNKKISIIAIKK